MIVRKAERNLNIVSDIGIDKRTSITSKPAMATKSSDSEELQKVFNYLDRNADGVGDLSSFINCKNITFDYFSEGNIAR